MLPYQIVNFHAALDKEEKNLSDIMVTLNIIDMPDCLRYHYSLPLLFTFSIVYMSNSLHS